jgi:3-oxoadipate enol-lactonase
MPYATTADNVKLWFEEAGNGPPLLFAHELCSDVRQWQGQIRHFSSRFRCVAYNARGYPPSGVPTSDEAYVWERFCGDIGVVLDAARADRAALLGWSMGAYAALQFARLHPDRVQALVLMGVGSGSPQADAAAWRALMRETSDAWLQDPGRGAEIMASADNRQALRRGNPAAFAAWLSDLKGHSPEGMARTCRNYQGLRPSLLDFEAEFRALEIPTLIVCGEEDAPCLQTSLWLREIMPDARLWRGLGLGHAPNLEDAEAFNREVETFLESVAAA